MAHRMQPLTRTEIDEWFIVDEINGKMYWKVRPCNRVKIGSEAGTLKCYVCDGKYMRHHNIHFSKKFYYRSWLIYAYHHSKWPDSNHVIRHINGDTTDDRISNLLEVTISCSQHNTTIRQTSGINIQYYKKSVYYHASIKNNNHRKYLGCFKTEEEAHKAYETEKEQYRIKEIRSCPKISENDTSRP